MRIGLIFVASFFFFYSALEADEIDDEVRELLELSNVIGPTQDLGKNLLDQLRPILTAQLSNTFRAQGIAVTAEEVDGIVNEFATRFINRFMDELIPLSIEEYKKHFTLDEIRELKELMKTEAFQKYAQRLPNIMQTAQVAGQNAGQRLGREIMVDIITNHPKFKNFK